MTELVRCSDARDAAGFVAREIAGAVRADPCLVLGLATGETMRPVYAALAEDRLHHGTSWRSVTVFNLDDYIGLPSTHPASFRRFMQQTLFDHLDIDPARCFIPDGSAEDLDREAEAYEDAIVAAGGLDLQLLGIGRNGHIAFNEPGAAFDSRTRVVELAPATRDAARASFDAPDRVPSRGLTMGIGTILAARRLLLLATGPDKADAVADALRPPPSTDRPASALQLHPDARIVADQAAATGVPLPRG